MFLLSAQASPKLVLAGEREELLRSLKLEPSIVEYDYQSKGMDGAQFSSSSKFRFDGKRYSFTRNMNRKVPPNQMESIYSDGEVIRVIEYHQSGDSDKLNQRSIKRDLQFESARTGSKAQVPGNAVTSAHCPVAGCIDGYFLSDYFTIESKLEKTGDEYILKCDSPLGVASCTFAIAENPVLRKVEILKTPKDQVFGSRILGDVLYDANEPKSRLTKREIQLQDIAGSGAIDSCKLVVVDSSERGIEGNTEYSYRVTMRDSNPKFEGAISPELTVKDGDTFQAIGATQLPFVWSSKYKWVVPKDAQLGNPLASNRGIYFLLGFAAILSCGIAAWVYGLRKR